MITFVTGLPGSGKSEYIYRRIREAVPGGGKIMLIVPEQQLLQSERELCSVLEADTPVPSLNVEVLSFTRLANRVFRKYGGLSYRPVNDSGRALIMWSAIMSVAPSLCCYAPGANPESETALMTDAVAELKRHSLDPSKLENTAGMLTSAPGLSAKLRDLALISSAYSKIMADRYDDSADDLSRLADVLRENNFFKSRDIYLDSFDGYTEAEYEIIRHIFANAASVTVTFGFLPGDNRVFLDGVRHTYLNLRRLARSLTGTDPDSVTLNDLPRFSSASLKRLCRNFWLHGSASDTAEPAVGISVFSCGSVYSEAEAAARIIANGVRSGNRYRDYTVIARDAGSYSGIIDAVFENHRIPCFFSVRHDLMHKPLIRMILSALSVIIRYWRREDVITYLKTGLAGVSPEDCDIIENYSYVWNINGKRWFDEYDWNMNYDGYSDTRTEFSLSVTARANQIRRSFTAPLVAFSEAFAPGATVKTISVALFDFLSRLGVSAASESDPESVSVWNTMVGCVEQLVDVSGDMAVTAEQYFTLLRMVATRADYGRLPAASDEVVVGSASVIRPGKPKYAILIGVNDGIFPGKVVENEIFSDNELIILEDLGLHLYDTSSDRAQDELHWFYKACLCASDGLYLIYSSASLSGEAKLPSLPLRHILSMFPDIKATDYDALPVIDRITDYHTGFEYIAPGISGTVGSALIDIYSRDNEYSSLIEPIFRPFGGDCVTLSPETAETLFGHDQYLTQARLEKFVLCAFGYHCSYSLKLSERKSAQLRPSDAGVFIHRILQRFFESERRLTDSDDAEISAELDEIISDYLKSVFGTDGNPDLQTGRIRSLARRLKRTSFLLVKKLITEFAQSDFVPRCFEQPISDKPDAIPPLRIPLPDGGCVSVSGIADRIDTYKKNGKVYIRVTDYKTGSSSFSLSDVSLGLNLQLLLYLFAAWNNGRSVLNAAPEEELVPAAAICYHAKLKQQQTLPGEDPIEKALSAAPDVSGICIDDESVLRAMEKNLEGRYIPVKISRGTITAKNLVSLENFGALMRGVTDTVTGIALEMKAGKASPSPTRKGSRDPCEYCDFRPVCRTSTASGQTSEV